MTFARRVVARPDTSFRLPEVSMGLVPGAGGTVSLPRRIGRQRTAWLALAGAVLGAASSGGLRPGSIVHAKVDSVDERTGLVVMDIGGKAEGNIPLSEFGDDLPSNTRQERRSSSANFERRLPGVG